MSFNKSTHCDQILNFIQIHSKISEKMDTELISQTTVTKNDG